MVAADLLAVDVVDCGAPASSIATGGCSAATQPFAVHRPATDHAEYLGRSGAVCTATRAALGRLGAIRRVAGLAFDATCSLVVLDAGHRPLTVSATGEDRWNVVMWADHRATGEAAEMTRTGHPVLDHVGGVMSP
jgi:ribulose kinase